MKNIKLFPQSKELLPLNTFLINIIRTSVRFDGKRVQIAERILSLHFVCLTVPQHKMQ